MGYECDFLDNIAYHASHINAIRSTFADKGVIPDEENSMLVTVEGSNVKINRGQAIFADGSRIRIGTDVGNEGEQFATLARIEGVKNYVYLERNAQSNNPRPVVSDAACGNDDILLAEIEPNGTVTDKRRFSKLKIPMQKNHTRKMQITTTVVPNAPAGVWSEIASVDLDYLGYQYVILRIDTSYEYGYYGVQNLTDLTGICFSRYSGGSYNMRRSEGLRIEPTSYYKFVIEGRKLKCYVTETSYSYYWPSKLLNITLL